MSIQDEIAFLTAIEAGVKAASNAAKARLLAFSAEHKIRSFDTEGMGQVNVVTKKPAVVLDDAAALAWVKEHHPKNVETVQRVNATFLKYLQSRLTIVAGRVVDTETGEFPDWAGVSDSGDPFVSYPASEEQKQVKAEAVAWVAGHVDQLARGFRQVSS